MTVLVIAACRSSNPSGNAPDPSTVSSSASLPGPPPTSKETLDPLDVLPSKPGELRVSKAWRVTASGVDLVEGIYDWPGTGATVRFGCSFPPSDKPDCDGSLPIRKKIADVATCASSNDDRDSQTGPMIVWPSCSIQVREYGVSIPRRFERLKAAAAQAIPWTQKVVGYYNGAASMNVLFRNRDEGLLEATRRGNVMKNLDISHQLDVGH